MNKSNKKELILYDYLKKNGFEHTFEEIAHSLHLTLRTLIYRYGSKEEMFDSVMNYWRRTWCEQFTEHIKDCNHTVEKLLIYIYMLRESYKQSTPFFLREIEKKDFLNSNLKYNFLTQLTELISVGIEQGYFKDINGHIFSKLLLFNVLYFFILEQYSFKYISYLLFSLLSEKGKELYEDIDILHFFDKNCGSLDRE